MLEELNAQGATIVVITHDRELAAHFPRRVEILDGHIVDRHRWRSESWGDGGGQLRRIQELVRER